MIPQLKVWWARGPEPGNFGDLLTPTILSLLDKSFSFEQLGEATHLFTGSIADCARPGMTVIGSGAMRSTDTLCADANWLAVRGPITVDMVRRAGGKPSGAMGDPALLLPLLYEPGRAMADQLGIVPHYVDAELARARHPDANLIAVLDASPLRVVEQICACDRIVSSSLHGIIVAHAYGIPAAWVRFSDELVGDPENLKFHDYAASVGIKLTPHDSIDDAEFVLPSTHAIEACQNQLMPLFQGL